MSFALHDASVPAGRAAWLRLWESWPGREVLAHPAYAALFAGPRDRVACAAWEGAGGAILFPLILRPLAAEPWARPGESRWDATSPYGYGGPYAWGSPDADAYWAAFEAWRAREGLVTTFARLSLFPGQLAPIPRGVEFNAPNVAVPLTGGQAPPWELYDSHARRSVRQAERAGVTVERDETGARLGDFIEAYEQTMRRHRASSFYFFPRPFFEALLAGLGGRAVFFHALHEGRVVSSDIVLRSEEHLYYFLSGTRDGADKLKASHLLKHREIEWGAELGKRTFVLGGGYGDGDGLMRFKRGFAPHGEVPFNVAKLVHDPAAAAELEAARAAGGSWTPRPGFFPPYRA